MQISLAQWINQLKFQIKVMNFVEKVKKLQNYFTAGKFKRVVEGCDALNKKFPNNSFILNLSGMAYQRLDKDHRAINLFELALKADNNNISAMNNLANSLKNIEEYSKAEQIYKKILEINPSYINVYNNYGNLKSEINDIENAIKSVSYTHLTLTTKRIV